MEPEEDIAKHDSDLYKLFNALSVTRKELNNIR